jgi:hypothetical protein
VLAIIPLDAPLALLIAVLVGGLGFYLSEATQSDGHRRPFMWWDFFLIGIPIVLGLFLEATLCLLGLILLVVALVRLGIRTITRSTLPKRYAFALLTVLAGLALPAYSFYARYYRLGIPQRESRIQARLGKINEAQNRFQMMEGRYVDLATLTREGVLESNGPIQDGFRFELTIAADGMSFQTTATPLHYGKRDVPFMALPYLSRLVPAPTGTRTFWMDQTGNLRGMDLKGRIPKSQEEIRALPWIKRF